MKGLKILAVLMALLMAASGITAAFAVPPVSPTMSPTHPTQPIQAGPNTTHMKQMNRNCTNTNCTCGNGSVNGKAGVGNGIGVGNGNKHKINRKKLEEIKNRIKNRIKRAGGIAAIEISYMNAKKRYYKLKLEYMRLKMEGKLDFPHQKEFCMAAGILVDKWFDNIEIAIIRSNLNETLKNELLQKVEQEKLAFEEKMQMINSSQNTEQLRNAVMQLREQWRQARLTVTQVALEIATVKLERTANIAEKLEVKLQRLAGNSTNAQQLLEDYSEKINAAKEMLNNAENLLSGNATYENLVAAKKDIMNAVRLMKEAFKDAREIVREVNMAGREIGMNIRAARAMNFKVMGNGTFDFTGSGMVTVVASNAKITYTGNIVNVTGFTVSGNTLTGSGKLTLNGTTLSVSVTGTNVNMIVRGSGTAKLSGTGVYWKRVGMQIMHENFNGTMEVTVGAVGGES